MRRKNLPVAAHLGEGGLQGTHQSATHVADADAETLLLGAVYGADHTRCFGGGVGDGAEGINGLWNFCSSVAIGVRGNTPRVGALAG